LQLTIIMNCNNRQKHTHLLLVNMTLLLKFLLVPPEFLSIETIFKITISSVKINMTNDFILYGKFLC